MYTYPEALNAMEKIAYDLFGRAYPDVAFYVRVVADAQTGTASVDWRGNPSKDSYVHVTINMPIRPATYRMSADEFTYWAAYLLHEYGHPAETDRVVWDEAVKTNRHRLLNSLEDVREEKCTIDRGVAHNALQVFSRLIDMLQAKAVAGGYDPNAVHSIGWTISALGRHANGYALDVSHITKNLDPKGIVGTIVPWALKDLKACANTQDCLDLADRIVAAVRAAKRAEKVNPIEELLEEVLEELDAEDPQPEPEEDLGLGSSGGMGEDRGSQGSDIPEDAPSASQEPKPEPEPEDVPSPAEEEFSDADIEEVDLAPNHREDMVSSGRDTETQRRVTGLIRRSLERAPVEKEITGRDKPYSVGGMGSVAFVTGNASGMGLQRALLARAMKANEMDSYEGNRTHGRLNTRALGRYASGNPNVFGKRVTSEGYDTDVQILVDGSGSMAGSNILAASSLALVVAQAASQVGVDCTAHVFNDDGLHVATKGKTKPKGNKFAYMANKIMGGTPLTESLLAVARLQDARAKGKRKILFVITDGGCNCGPAVVKGAGQYVEQTMGTEIANLHIGRMPMKIFRNEVAVDVTKVKQVGLKQLTSLLERGL